MQVTRSEVRALRASGFIDQCRISVAMGGTFYPELFERNPKKRDVALAFRLNGTHARTLLLAMDEFHLHERLAAGSADLGRHGICRVLLKHQAHFLWIVLVPEVPETITELHHLSENDYRAVTFSIRAFSAFVEESFAVDKINIASIGNQVRQLHFHVVGRKLDDIAWPGVVWACSEKLPYEPAEWTRRQHLIREFITKNQPIYGYC